MSERPPWSKYLMGFAEHAAQRASCPRLSVGAAIVRDRSVLATGYNGAPRGEESCLEAGCRISTTSTTGSCERVVHAELNALMQAARVGQACEGATLYVTHAPCFDCAGHLINAGITQVIYAADYHSPAGVNRLWLCGVKVQPLAYVV